MLRVGKKKKKRGQEEYITGTNITGENSGVEMLDDSHWYAHASAMRVWVFLYERIKKETTRFSFRENNFVVLNIKVIYFSDWVEL